MTRAALIFAAGIILSSCGGPKQLESPFAKNDPWGLPKFRLVEVLDGSLVQLSEDGTVLVQPRTAGMHGNEILASNYQNLVSLRDLHYKTATPNLKAWRAGQMRVIPGNSFVGSDGSIHPYLEDKVVTVKENGRRIGVLPLRIPSERYRYYAGTNSIYASSLKTGEMSKIYDEPVVSNLRCFDDVLYMSKAMPDGSGIIVRFGPNQKPRSIYHSLHAYEARVTDRSLDGGNTVHDILNFFVQSPTGNLQPVYNASFDMKFLDFKRGHYMIGFALAISADGKKNSSPAIWNENGEPVLLSKLCPELKTRIVAVTEMQIGKILTNKSGLVAIELSGYNLSPKSEVNLPSGDQDYVYKTYVLQALNEVAIP